jgi:hypothetical protein
LRTVHARLFWPLPTCDFVENADGRFSAENRTAVGVNTSSNDLYSSPLRQVERALRAIRLAYYAVGHIQNCSTRSVMPFVAPRLWPRRGGNAFRGSRKRYSLSTPRPKDEFDARTDVAPILDQALAPPATPGHRVIDPRAPVRPAGSEVAAARVAIPFRFPRFGLQSIERGRTDSQ